MSHKTTHLIDLKNLKTYNDYMLFGSFSTPAANNRSETSNSTGLLSLQPHSHQTQGE